MPGQRFELTEVDAERVDLQGFRPGFERLQIPVAPPNCEPNTESDLGAVVRSSPVGPDLRSDEWRGRGGP
jgi:hypothetical protein